MEHTPRPLVRRAVGALLCAAVTAVVLFGSPVDAFAKGKPPPVSTSSATLTAPANVGVGQGFHVSGTGYAPNKQTWVRIQTPSSLNYVNAVVNASGVLSLDYLIWDSGSSTLSSSQGAGTMATTTVTVG